MSQRISDKVVVHHIVEHCHAHGVKHIVLSPGSRNAPLILSFPASKKFKCFTIVDERSAAYFALGLARGQGSPVALVCTSGTASLNYTPAMAEAFHQQIPLIAITADRPPEYIDQADGQTIRQEGIFSNFVRYQCQLPLGDLTPGDKWLVDRSLNEAFRNALGTVSGPVHINVPFREPLYGRSVHDDLSGVRIVPAKLPAGVDTDIVDSLADEITIYRKVMLIVGASSPDEEFSLLLGLLMEKGVVVIVENLSNVQSVGVIGNTDRVLEGFSEDNNGVSPDLLITLDVPVLSKKLKHHLRKHPPKAHWHFSNQTVLVDTYQCLTRQIAGNALAILSALVRKISFFPSDYFQLWHEADRKTTELHWQYMEKVSWSDLLVFERLRKSIPEGQEIHLGNSTPVRYAQLFGWRDDQAFFANRGTSGIDGSVSTAAGAAFAGKRPVTLIIGDLGFFYDSNGLWHEYLPSSFRVIVVNNGGGGIFRFIPGPSDTEELEPFFEARGNHQCRGVAETFGLQYYAAGNSDELQLILQHFWEDKGVPALLEIFTPGDENGEILRSYFRFLRQ